MLLMKKCICDAGRQLTSAEYVFHVMYKNVKKQLLFIIFFYLLTMSKCLFCKKKIECILFKF